MKRVPQQYLFVVGIRWAVCSITALLLLRAGSLTPPVDGVSIFLLSYSAIYTACWTWLLQRWWSRVHYGGAPLVYDLVLSALPMWADGGWSSPFFSVALGALIVPALSLRWRNGLVAATLFTVIDQLILWSTVPTPWEITQRGQTLLLLGRVLVPYAIVLLITGAMRGLYRRQRHPPRQRTPLRSPRRSVPQRQNLSVAAGETASYERDSMASQSNRTLSTVAAHPPATARRTATSVQALLRQLRSELDAAGVSLVVQIEGDDQYVPSQIKTLLLRALEVAIDNVLTHAHASSVVISLRINASDALLEIVDDGVGLWDGTAEPPGFHQIKRLRYCVEELDGAFWVIDRPEGGVMLKLRIPLE